MVIERQGGWPNSNVDIFRSIDFLSTERLDHHGLFTASTTVNRMAQGFIRKLSGLGELPTTDSVTNPQTIKFDTNTVIIGGGASGIKAAITLSQAGQKVVIFEANPELGGHLLDGSCQLDAQKDQRGTDVLAGMKKELHESENVELHASTGVIAVYPGENIEILATNEEETFLIHAERVLFCTGAYDQLPLFVNNDLPGIFSLRAFDKLIYQYGVVPGEPVLLIGESRQTLQLASDLIDLKVGLAGVVTNQSDNPLLEKIKASGTDVISGYHVISARGGRWLDRIELAPLGKNEAELVIDCQSCAIDGPKSPAYELAHHTGCRVSFNSKSGHFVVCDQKGQTSNSIVFAAGHVGGAASVDQAISSGERAGLACALSYQDDEKLAARLVALTKQSQANG
jgi:sarcosine oxidase subunit alpha